MFMEQDLEPQEHMVQCLEFLAQNSSKRTVVGDGKQSRDFTYVTDVCDAFIRW